MRAILSVRGLLLLWIILTASIGLNIQLKGMSEEIKKNAPGLIPSINQAFDFINREVALQTATNFFKNVKFNPDTVVADVKGVFVFQTRHVLVFVGFIFLVIAVILYQRAIRSDSFADDFIALLFFYVFVVIEISIVFGLGFNVQPALQRGYVLAAFVLIIGLLSIRGGALHDSRLFFRALLQIIVLSLFLFPDVTIQNAANILQLLSDFGNNLKTSTSAFYLFWSIIGGLLALGELYTLSKKPPVTPTRRPGASRGGGGLGGLMGGRAAPRAEPPYSTPRAEG